MNFRRLALTVILVFVAAVSGVVVGHHFVNAGPAGSELHALLHDQLALDAEQERRVHALERDFAVRQRALEGEMRAENARLAAAINSERNNGPRVAAAVDASHETMGRLQKETLAHMFAMRKLLRPDQTAKFDAAVTKALTEDAR